VKYRRRKTSQISDFKYSWERAANPATGSQTAATYLGDIVGVKDMLAGRSDQIKGVKVIDDLTLQVTIDSPKSYFLSKLTFPTSFVVNRENIAQGVEWWKKPNGTGPFKFKQWTFNQSLTMERNDNYYGDVPKIKQVNYQFYSGLPMDLYEKKQIDITSVSTTYIDKVTDKTGPFYQELEISPEFSFSYLGYNCNKPPFDDVNIRRAFNLAVDKDKIISLVIEIWYKANGSYRRFAGYNDKVAG
jgi:oligopeptide transport system substrate-binding protein